MNSNFKDLLSEFAEAEVRYLIVGGYAAMHYSQPRFTKDLDLYLEPSEENADRVMKAFVAFGLPLIDVEPEHFAEPGLQYLVGRSPVQIDFLTSLPGVDSFDQLWDRRDTVEKEGVVMHFLAKDDVIVAKKHADRPIDRSDIEEIRMTDEAGE